MTKKLSVNGKEIINLNDLIFLQLLTVIYSTSDYSHPIITPALLIMENYLSQAIINNERDIIRGLYLCNIMYMVSYKYFSNNNKYKGTTYINNYYLILIN